MGKNKSKGGGSDNLKHVMPPLKRSKSDEKSVTENCQGKTFAKLATGRKRRILYLDAVHALKKTPEWKDMGKMLDPELDEDTRMSLWTELCTEGDILRKQYSWAIPDERALSIISNFGPIVEVGAGGGYWAMLLKERGVDILAYDRVSGEPASETEENKKSTKKYLKKKSQSSKKSGSSSLGSEEGSAENEESSSDSDDEIEFWTTVEKGGSEVLEHDDMKDRTLLLCYPDDFESNAEDSEAEEDASADGSSYSLALACWNAYEGDTIIHVGELLGDARQCGGGGTAVWGRTSSAAFQLALHEGWHCILKAEIPRWPHISGDCITVWKRHGTQVFEFENDLAVSDIENDSPDKPEKVKHGGSSKGKERSGEEHSSHSAEHSSRSAEHSSRSAKHFSRSAERSSKEGSGGERSAKEDSSSGSEGDHGIVTLDLNDLVQYSVLPPEERLSSDIAIGSLEHLLKA